MPKRKDLLLPYDIVSSLIVLCPDLSILEDDFVETLRILYKKDKKEICDAIDYSIMLGRIIRYNKYLVLNTGVNPEENYKE